ncbi:ABC transporter permease [Undibacterium sp. CY18W]|uniref:ABC transporter permease n=1 Tax=Undibacterium hunanense TaxID=2762292 RepID=A0ABR6ZVB4_9BURK|nr:ABC transporter permease [Undibacterium hunanense]MBC3919553.1 ABC transporter permease [Undibacterium hunanense]
MTHQTSPADIPHDPAWRMRVTATLCMLVLLWPMLLVTEFKPWQLIDAQSLGATWRFLSGFFPPAHSTEFLLIVLEATWQTIAIATAGLTLALLGAIPMTLIVNEHLSISRIGSGRMHGMARLLRQIVRWKLVLLRSVPELVWALLFVRLVGLGPTAGVFAIALTYAGMLGKVYAEILEANDAHATDSLLRNGSSRLTAFLYGALPNAAPELISYTIYRWECAIRGSVVMGFVGAGGLGQRMDESMKMLSGAEVSTMLLVFVLLVGIADLASKLFRKALA